MFVVIVYDVNVDRVNPVRKYLKTHLTWVQNSVLEGTPTRAELREIENGLKDIIDEKEDTIYIYKTSTEKYVDKTTLGQPKGERKKII